jgi:hypothetical protein
MQGDSFFKLPTLGQYLEWAEQQGCLVEHSERFGTPMVKITASDKSRSIIEFGMKLEEGMLPTQVWHYDRNLKVQSPWSSWNPDDFFNNPRA